MRLPISVGMMHLNLRGPLIQDFRAKTRTNERFAVIVWFEVPAVHDSKLEMPIVMKPGKIEVVLAKGGCGYSGSAI